ncbi:MAG: hypothetical protein IPO92_06570 [Saprospiraceae bacterium]|nr:hypothetical protein [Saprospiraceae bacterium]
MPDICNATPTSVDNIVNCVGTITYTWATTDYCGRPLNYQQILTVMPPPLATLINPPPSTAINCPDIPLPGVLPSTELFQRFFRLVFDSGISNTYPSRQYCKL